MEGIPHIYKLFGWKSEKLGVLTHLKRDSSIGEMEFLDETLSRSDALSQVEASITQITEAIEPWEEKLLGKARTQRRAFAWGVTMLVIARGMPPILAILEQVLS